MKDRTNDLARIEQALLVAGEILQRFQPGNVAASHKANFDPVTEADLAVDAAVKTSLVRDGEGWLSEETADDHARLRVRRAWVVDPPRRHQRIRRGASRMVCLDSPGRGW